nr:SIR2 family protein [uncultured Duncaniella sp.]
MDAILFGNGFNLLSKDCPSWQDLLTSISDRENSPILNGIPPTLQYEQVYLAPHSSFSDLSDESDETKLKDAVKRRLSTIGTNEFYKKLLSLGVSTFLTTNYDHALYDNDESSVIGKNSSEKIYSIKRWKRIRLNDNDYTIFQFHGDITNVKSIMLGLDHYGGALAKVQDYVKGYFNEKSKDKKTSSKSNNQYSISNRLTSDIEIDASIYGFTDNGTSLISWIDAFFFSNLHIIGITIDFSEIDIWWLLSRRARMLKNGTLANQIYYYPTFPLSEIHYHLPKLRLLERLGVKVIYHKQTIDIETGYPDYPQIYNEQIRNMGNILKEP